MSKRETRQFNRTSIEIPMKKEENKVEKKKEMRKETTTVSKANRQTNKQARHGISMSFTRAHSPEKKKNTRYAPSVTGDVRRDTQAVPCLRTETATPSKHTKKKYAIVLSYHDRIYDSPCLE